MYNLHVDEVVESVPLFFHHLNILEHVSSCHPYINAINTINPEYLESEKRSIIQENFLLLKVEDEEDDGFYYINKKVIKAPDRIEIKFNNFKLHQEEEYPIVLRINFAENFLQSDIEFYSLAAVLRVLRAMKLLNFENCKKVRKCFLKYIRECNNTLYDGEATLLELMKDSSKTGSIDAIELFLEVN